MLSTLYQCKPSLVLVECLISFVIGSIGCLNYFARTLAAEEGDLITIGGTQMIRWKTLLSRPTNMCVCACVCERERQYGVFVRSGEIVFVWKGDW